MLADGWFQQRRNVQRLSCFAGLKTGEERALRHAIRQRSREVLTSRQTLLFAAATGEFSTGHWRISPKTARRIEQ